MKTPITRTNIYRSIAPCIRKQDRKEFARMLELARSSDSSGSTFREGRGDLTSAFCWEWSPQKAQYWAELYRRLCSAGFSKQARGF